MTDDEIIKSQAVQIAMLTENQSTSFEMHRIVSDAHQKFMDQCGETWVWKYEYDQALDMLNYVASEAKRLDCHIARRHPADNLWWEPLQDAD